MALCAGSPNASVRPHTAARAQSGVALAAASVGGRAQQAGSSSGCVGERGSRHMTALRVAWRIRNVAVYASIVPFLVMLAFALDDSPFHGALQFVVARSFPGSNSYFSA